MNTDALKINLAQSILNIADNSILESVNQLLMDRNIVGYDATRNPIYEAAYIKELD